MQDIHSKAAAVRLIVFDVDGVLTDGSLFIGDDGQEYKAFNSKDGHGMVMLQQSGVEIAIITGRTSEVVRIRMASLGIERVYQGKREKLPAYEEIKQITGFDDEQIAYVADGEVLFICEGAEPQRLQGGDVYAIPPNKPHTIQLLSERARLVDTFHPIREDFITSPEK